MLGKHIRELEKLKSLYCERLDNLHDSNADPHMKAMCQSNIEYEILKIEKEIKHEKDMLPFKYLFAVFMVAELSLIIYFY
jgi:hypothetical protein